MQRREIAGDETDREQRHDHRGDLRGPGARRSVHGATPEFGREERTEEAAGEQR
jgi:hypothetical protein